VIRAVCFSLRRRSTSARRGRFFVNCKLPVSTAPGVPAPQVRPSTPVSPVPQSTARTDARSAPTVLASGTRMWDRVDPVKNNHGPRTRERRPKSGSGSV
jgi:hypothetical protein